MGTAYSVLTDPNGNLLTDAHKGLAVAYNYLNLPNEISFGSGNGIRWLFTATGAKLRRTTVTAGAVTEVKEYAGGFVYRYEGDPEGDIETASPVLDYFSMGAGRVKYYASDGGAGGGTSGSTGGSTSGTEAFLAYQYTHADHLGTLRVMYEPNGQDGTSGGGGVKQFASYYPYGLGITTARVMLSGGSSTNEDLLGGKELTDAFGLGWYHYGARFYDAATARWTTMDPADEFHSPYVYVGGDPVNLVDPDGRQSVDIQQDIRVREAAGLDPDSRYAYKGTPEEGDALLNAYFTVVELFGDTFGDGFELATGYTIAGREGDRRLAAGALLIPGASSKTLKLLKDNGSRLLFQGLEVRAVRPLDHIDESTLRGMQRHGFAPTDVDGNKIILHHHLQRPGGPIIEMPANRHSIGNPRQHPYGNQRGSGLTPEQRSVFDSWRVDYWKTRATDELNRRGAE